MRIIGVAFTLGGWLLAISGLFISTSNMVRAVIACLGIALCLAGSLGFINSHSLSQAVWKKQ